MKMFNFDKIYCLILIKFIDKTVIICYNNYYKKERNIKKDEKRNNIWKILSTSFRAC